MSSLAICHPCSFQEFDGFEIITSKNERNGHRNGTSKRPFLPICNTAIEGSGEVVKSRVVQHVPLHALDNRLCPEPFLIAYRAYSKTSPEFSTCHRARRLTDYSGICRVRKHLTHVDVQRLGHRSALTILGRLGSAARARRTRIAIFTNQC